jgi:tripartite-type tricarboxylate transporter receptor subunit TctC
VVVNNRAGGGGGNIGADLVARAAPDGCMLVMGFVGPQAVNTFLFDKMPHDPVRDDSVCDFAPVAMVVKADGLLAVHPSRPVRTEGELIALAKAQPCRRNGPLPPCPR